MRGSGTYLVDTTAKPENDQDAIDRLARRHVTFVFNDKQSKSAPGLMLSEARDSVTGKFTVTVNPSVPAELRRAFGKELHAEGMVTSQFGVVLAHLDDHMEKKAGITTKILLKVLRQAESERLLGQSMMKPV